MSTATYDQYETDLSVMELADHEPPLTLLMLWEKYKKLSLLLHPDKHPQEDSAKYTELFQTLSSSYQRLRVFVTENTDVAKMEGEEANLYEFFNQHNIVHHNNMLNI